MPDTQRIVSREEWLQARKQLLAREKAFTQQRDELSQARRDLPRVRIDKEYTFDSANGRVALSALFQGKSQLVVYHLMFGPDATEACKSCSFWADHFDPTVVHLAHRDVAFAAVSRGPLERLRAYAKRLGWNFNWVSSQDSDFNFDFGVSFTKEQVDRGRAPYNFGTFNAPGTEMPGFSVFEKDASGAIYHTYSTYGRGIELANATYQNLDLVPKGRDESREGPMAWVRRHDEYAR
jgi:predicted dithiol-disulfide oxidoreductase (DUF899 family)